MLRSRIHHHHWPSGQLGALNCISCNTSAANWSFIKIYSIQFVQLLVRSSRAAQKGVGQPFLKRLNQLLQLLFTCLSSNVIPRAARLCEQRTTRGKNLPVYRRDTGKDWKETKIHQTSSVILQSATLGFGNAKDLPFLTQSLHLTSEKECCHCPNRWAGQGISLGRNKHQSKVKDCGSELHCSETRDPATTLHNYGFIQRQDAEAVYLNHRSAPSFQLCSEWAQPPLNHIVGWFSLYKGIRVTGCEYLQPWHIRIAVLTSGCIAEPPCLYFLH